jgi:hypothetical protein
MKQKTLSEIIATLLILLFVYAGASKLFVYNEFKSQLGRSPVVKSIAPYLAFILPLTEFITAGMLAVTATRSKGFLLSAILMTLFTGYIIYMLLFEKHLPCSCGGVLEQLTWKQHLLFNIFFLGIALAGIRIETHENLKRFA